MLFKPGLHLVRIGHFLLTYVNEYLNKFRPDPYDKYEQSQFRYGLDTQATSLFHVFVRLSWLVHGEDNEFLVQWSNRPIALPRRSTQPYYWNICCARWNQLNIKSWLIINALKFAEFPDHVCIDYVVNQAIAGENDVWGVTTGSTPTREKLENMSGKLAF